MRLLVVQNGPDLLGGEELHVGHAGRFRPRHRLDVAVFILRGGGGARAEEVGYDSARVFGNDSASDVLSPRRIKASLRWLCPLLLPSDAVAVWVQNLVGQNDVEVGKMGHVETAQVSG